MRPARAVPSRCKHSPRTPPASKCAYSAAVDSTSRPLHTFPTRGPLHLFSRVPASRMPNRYFSHLCLFNLTISLETYTMFNINTIIYEYAIVQILIKILRSNYGIRSNHAKNHGALSSRSQERLLLTSVYANPILVPPFWQWSLIKPFTFFAQFLFQINLVYGMDHILILYSIL